MRPDETGTEQLQTTKGLPVLSPIHQIKRKEIKE
jgi:hypothetical protein